jgi:hypothetical protein
MEMTFVTSCPSTPAKLAFLACLLWPWIALALLPSRGRSSAPIAAMLVPLAISTVAMWVGLLHAMQGLALSGSSPRAASAGIAEALGGVGVGAGSAAFVALFALMRRHRAIVDRGAVTMTLFLLVQLCGAIVLGATFGMARWQFAIPYTGAIVSATAVVAAAVRTWLAGRGRLEPRPIRYGLPLVAGGWALGALALWQQVGHYTAIALGR